MTGAAPPGWHPDPHGGGGLRWWDGSAWTSHVHPPQRSAAQVAADLLVERWHAEYSVNPYTSHEEDRRSRYPDAERAGLAVALDAVRAARADGETIVLVRAEADVLGDRDGALAVLALAVTDRGGLVARTEVDLPSGPVAPPAVLREPPTRVTVAKQRWYFPWRGPIGARWTEQDGLGLLAGNAADRRRVEAFVSSPTSEPLDDVAPLLSG